MAASVGEAGDWAGLGWKASQRRARRRFGDVGQRNSQEEEKDAPAGHEAVIPDVTKNARGRLGSRS
ncbi:hypothetical protein CKAH01_13882 [Colletotrichum kahawae]|uniref:Peptidase C51 domain-containing protein n=1 Tax=Colletotrichum kahawae TaxID=34407 RepID=A0AAE0DAJ9_COLKA|nr:hypothetical protein CKAH01_13882 [Colletotrichum kahawae]